MSDTDTKRVEFDTGCDPDDSRLETLFELSNSESFSLVAPAGERLTPLENGALALASTERCELTLEVVDHGGIPVSEREFRTAGYRYVTGLDTSTGARWMLCCSYQKDGSVSRLDLATERSPDDEFDWRPVSSNVVTVALEGDRNE